MIDDASKSVLDQLFTQGDPRLSTFGGANAFDVAGFNILAPGSQQQQLGISDTNSSTSAMFGQNSLSLLDFFNISAAEMTPVADGLTRSIGDPIDIMTRMQNEDQQQQQQQQPRGLTGNATASADEILAAIQQQMLSIQQQQQPPAQTQTLAAQPQFDWGLLTGLLNNSTSTSSAVTQTAGSGQLNQQQQPQQQQQQGGLSFGNSTSNVEWSSYMALVNNARESRR
ncbi:hypothetical protein GQ42DRAFT_159517 [Ramicandelaber brevisporus]|nr:hypothetical protein GQ42DRAFT_159517 [Ramicandelaber brevisporus]